MRIGSLGGDMPGQGINLEYGPLGSAQSDPDQKRIKNISTVVQTGKHLWLASDENSTIERLSWEGNAFTNARSFDLAEYFTLPGEKPEIDIEGLCVAGDLLWICGSHSRNRKAPKNLKGSQDRDIDDDLARLADNSRPKRRCLLGCVRLSSDHTKIASPKDGSALCLPFGKGGNTLTRHLAADDHIGPFVELPDKENGLDIEGLAVKGERIFLGLRGPVIGGYAIILEVAVREAKGALTLRKIGSDGKPYRKHFVNLGGLGIRDLAVEDDGLLILAGPTMSVPGPWSVMHWPEAFAYEGEGVLNMSMFKPGITIRQRAGDHPEGITAFEDASGKRGWLVVYDRPLDERVTVDGIYTADFFS